MCVTWWQMKIVCENPHLWKIHFAVSPSFSAHTLIVDIRKKNSLSVIYLLESKWQCHESLSTEFRDCILDLFLLFIVASISAPFSFGLPFWQEIPTPKLLLTWSIVRYSPFSTSKQIEWQIAFQLLKEGNKFNQTFLSLLNLNYYLSCTVQNAYLIKEPLFGIRVCLKSIADNKKRAP